MGYRQVALALRNEQGLCISGKTVLRLMREEGLSCKIRRRKYNSFESFKAELDEYIVYWNTRRYQVRLKGMTPVQYRGHSIRAA